MELVTHEDIRSIRRGRSAAPVCDGTATCNLNVGISKREELILLSHHAARHETKINPKGPVPACAPQIFTRADARIDRCG